MLNLIFNFKSCHISNYAALHVDEPQQLRRAVGGTAARRWCEMNNEAKWLVSNVPTQIRIFCVAHAP